MFVHWGCRLEDIINKALDRGMMARKEADEKLRAMFWEGMKESLKCICRFLNASIKNFDKLRVAVRGIEQSHNKRIKEANCTKKTTSSKIATTNTEPSNQH